MPKSTRHIAPALLYLLHPCSRDAAGIVAQNRLNMRHIEPLCSLYSSNFGLTSPPARYELP
jgi:hypothetical protein